MTSSSVKIDVPTASRAYQVHVGIGTVRRLRSLIKNAGGSGQCFVISSPTIWKLHGRTIQSALKGSEVILIPDGERSKTIRTVSGLYESLIQSGADRSITIVAVGGGVIGDVVGFAASTFLRGVQLVQVPTTLLAQVDSAIGGKVGVNHSLGKNLIGAFHQPIVVVADPKLLKTLPRREFRSGLYEVVKYGIIASQRLFDRINTNLTEIFTHQPSVLIPIIGEACQIKATIVAKDERESGLRRTLNFGHTVGHAIESVTHYRRFRHGEAVAYGMLAAAHIAVRRQMFSPANEKSLANLIGKLGPLPQVSDLSTSAVLAAVRRDKKVLQGRLHMVLPIAVGKTKIVGDVTDREIIRSLKTIGIHRKL